LFSHEKTHSHSSWASSHHLQQHLLPAQGEWASGALCYSEPCHWNWVSTVELVWNIQFFILLGTSCAEAMCSSWEISNRWMQVNSTAGKSWESYFEYFECWQSLLLSQKPWNNSAFSLYFMEGKPQTKMGLIALIQVWDE
jgi:hypothetical protein